MFDESLQTTVQTCSFILRILFSVVFLCGLELYELTNKLVRQKLEKSWSNITILVTS